MITSCCPICGESDDLATHRCNPSKLAAIERGRLAECNRQEGESLRIHQVGHLIDLGATMLALVGDRDEFDPDCRKPGEYPLAAREENYHIDGTAF